MECLFSPSDENYHSVAGLECWECLILLTPHLKMVKSEIEPVTFVNPEVSITKSCVLNSKDLVAGSFPACVLGGQSWGALAHNDNPILS